MKNFTKILLLIGLGFGLNSCQEQVETVDYLNIPYLNSNRAPHVFPEAPTEVTKNVLVEEYTGHQCGNCPEAARLLKGIIKQDAYKDQVIAVAIHGDGGFFTEFDPNAEKFYYNFTTPEGIEIDQKFGISSSGLPKGMVNRTIFDSQISLAHGIWQSAIDNELNKLAVAWVDVYSTVEPSNSNIITTDVRVKFLENYSGNVKANVILVESGIINYQKEYDTNFQPDGSSTIPNYEHNHILRYNHSTNNRNLFGTWGSDITETTKGSDGIKRISTTLEGTDWKVENMHAIAYIYDTETNEILQVKEVKIKH
ncbi:MAG: Omp28-related outer membrane protein [Flavobacteriales bacterium]